MSHPQGDGWVRMGWCGLLGGKFWVLIRSRARLGMRCGWDIRPPVQIILCRGYLFMRCGWDIRPPFSDWPQKWSLSRLSSDCSNVYRFVEFDSFLVQLFLRAAWYFG